MLTRSPLKLASHAVDSRVYCLTDFSHRLASTRSNPGRFRTQCCFLSPPKPPMLASFPPASLTAPTHQSSGETRGKAPPPLCFEAWDGRGQLCICGRLWSWMPRLPCQQAGARPGDRPEGPGPPTRLYCGGSSRFSGGASLDQLARLQSPIQFQRTTARSRWSPLPPRQQWTHVHRHAWPGPGQCFYY